MEVSAQCIYELKPCGLASVLFHAPQTGKCNAFRVGVHSWPPFLAARCLPCCAPLPFCDGVAGEGHHPMHTSRDLWVSPEPCCDLTALTSAFPGSYRGEPLHPQGSKRPSAWCCPPPLSSSVFSSVPWQPPAPQQVGVIASLAQLSLFRAGRGP